MKNENISQILTAVPPELLLFPFSLPWRHADGWLELWQPFWIRVTSQRTSWFLKSLPDFSDYCGTGRHVLRIFYRLIQAGIEISDSVAVNQENRWKIGLWCVKITKKNQERIHFRNIILCRDIFRKDAPEMMVTRTHIHRVHSPARARRRLAPPEPRVWRQRRYGHRLCHSRPPAASTSHTCTCARLL